MKIKLFLVVFGYYGYYDWYRIKVNLMDASYSIIDSWDTGYVQSTGNFTGHPYRWALIHHTFSGYGTPVRYITYENWVGNYGATFDEAFVNILNVP